MTPEEEMERRKQEGVAFLDHHGMKGMKWGYRKDETSSGGRPSSAKTTTAPKPPKKPLLSPMEKRSLAIGGTILAGRLIVKMMMDNNAFGTTTVSHQSEWVVHPQVHETWAQQMAQSGMRYNPNATLDPSQAEDNGVRGPGPLQPATSGTRSW